MRLPLSLTGEEFRGLISLLGLNPPDVVRIPDSFSVLPLHEMAKQDSIPRGDVEQPLVDIRILLCELVPKIISRC